MVMMINLCQLWLATVILLALLVNFTSFVEAGKKKEKTTIIVLSNGGCGGNILVKTGDKGKKGGGGHKILVKGGDSGGGGGCGCSNSCGTCGGGGHSGHNHEHHTIQHVPIPIPVPAGHPLPPPHEMHAAMMSRLNPVFSAEEPHASASSSDSVSDSPNDQDTQASDSSSTHDSSKSSSTSSSSSSSASSSGKSDMAAPLFIPSHAVTPPWFHGSPVFVDPSIHNRLSSTIKSKSSASSSDSNHSEKEYTSSSDIAPTFNDPIYNLHGPNGQFLPPGFPHGFDANHFASPLSPQFSEENTKKDENSSENEKKSQSTGRNRNSYIQPLIDSVQRLLRGPGPLHSSLPRLRSSSGNRDSKPSGASTSSSSSSSLTGNRSSRYLDSLRHRLRPLTALEGNSLTSTIENLWKNLRGRSSSSSSSKQSSTSEPKNHLTDINGNKNYLDQHQIHHHQHPLSPLPPPNGHPHHFNIPGQQNNQVMQQYLEQVLTSKWWEWPSGGLLGPNLNQY